MWARRLPWIDGLAGLVVGVAILGLRSVLVGFYGLSSALLTIIGVANVAYSSLGLTLGPRRPRPGWHLSVLVAANLAWAVVCLVLIVRVWSSARWFGIAHLAGEGTFVLALALLEWRHRRTILSA